VGADPSRIIAMNALAVVWHFWIAVALVVPVVLAVVGIGVGYLYKVVLPRFPREPQT
jgi:hypothetical protein